MLPEKGRPIITKWSGTVALPICGRSAHRLTCERAWRPYRTTAQRRTSSAAGTNSVTAQADTRAATGQGLSPPACLEFTAHKLVKMAQCW